MSFPISPTEGQIYNNYEYTDGRWNKTYHKHGMTIQTVDYETHPDNDMYLTSASGVERDTGITVTITPKYSTSKLIIDGECQIRMIDTFGGTLSLKRDGSYVNPSYQQESLTFFYKGEALNHHSQEKFQTSVIAGNTNPTTFTIFFTPYGNGTGEIGNGWGNRRIQVQEIKQ